jgi:hypothetical protein
MTPEPEFVQPAPYGIELEAGKDYWFCACGKYVSNLNFKIQESTIL